MTQSINTQDITVTMPVKHYVCDTCGATADVPQYSGIERRNHLNDVNPVADWLLNVQGKDFDKKECLATWANA